MPGDQKQPTVCSSAMPGAVPDNARGSAGLSIAPTGAEVTNVAGVAGSLSGSIMPSGAASCRAEQFHANRHIELTGLDQTAEGFGPGGRVCGMGLRNWSGELVWGMEPSAKWSINMEGALLRHGPSVISSLRVDGWFCLHRTVRDSGLKRGGFAPGY